MTTANPGAAPASDTSDSVLLFTSFRKNGEDGLHLAWSCDGYEWKALRNEKSFLAPKVGGGLMRDPNLIRGPDGTFHMVWTTAWNKHGIGYASSRDLLQWSDQKLLDVMKQANARAVASRELGSASLRKTGSGQPAKDGEASIGREESIPCTDRTPRGGRRQRARKEPLGTWEARFGVLARKAEPPLAGSHNRWRGRIAASEGLIVASICRSSRQGAKEPWPESSRVRGTRS
ncbi:MAG: hypothetical protein FJ387_27485 [Verrucomicrobia bacterium]|nr:hypothetical protein [Verrucomicrobiota bacterium]